MITYRVATLMITTLITITYKVARLIIVIIMMMTMMTVFGDYDDHLQGDDSIW